MSEHKYFSNFYLTNPKTGRSQSLEDFGGMVYNDNNEYYTKILLPTPNHITDKNDTFDGEKYEKTTYGTKTIEIPCFFHGDRARDLDAFNMWVGKKHQQVFHFEGDYKEIDVVYNGEQTMSFYYGDELNAMINLKFIAHSPYWRLRNEKPIIYNNPALNEQLIIPYQGNSNSYPLIKITPNGTQGKIRFKFNDLEVSLSNIDKDFYIDCQKKRCYEYVNGIITPTLNKYALDDFCHFPIINCEEGNYFKLLEGSISKLSIDLKTRII